MIGFAGVIFVPLLFFASLLFSLFWTLFWATGGAVFAVKLGIVNLFCPEACLGFLISCLSIRCCGVLSFCGLLVLVFVGHYFRGVRDGGFLIVLLSFFIGIMFCLFSSGSWLWTFLFWELLGLVSVFLILFSLGSNNARGAILTLFVSRVGDASLFFVLGGSFLGFFGWDLLILSIGLSFLVLTKSACFPFTFWLPEAMWAPTPVSSLVHSSTLVASGVWFLFRYEYLFDSVSWSLLFGLSLSTIVGSSLFALVFDDVKKLMALSTCNNIAWCVVFCLFGGWEIALVQLVVHGVCKCAFFIFLGDLVLVSRNSQSAKSQFCSSYGDSLYGGWCILSLLFCLCGMPFLGLFFGKHVVFGFLGSMCMFRYVFFLLVCLLLTSIYCFRFMVVLGGGLCVFALGWVRFFFMAGFCGVLGTFLSFICSWFFVPVEPDFYWGSFILFTQLFGAFFGLFVGYGSWGFSGAGSLNYADSLVNRVYFRFLDFGRVLFELFVYRWEVDFLCFFNYCVSEVRWPAWIIFFGGAIGVLFLWFSVHFW